jgi:hypothetical protein
VQLEEGRRMTAAAVDRNGMELDRESELAPIKLTGGICMRANVAASPRISTPESFVPVIL